VLDAMSFTCEFNGHGSWPFAARFISLVRRVLAGICGYPRAGVAAGGVGVFAGPAALGDAGSSGLRVLAGGVRCAGGSGGQRRCRRGGTRSAAAAVAPAAGRPRWRDLAPPARTVVPACFCLNCHGGKSLRPARPARVTVASAAAVCGHDGAAVLVARFKRRVFPGRAEQIAWARDFTRRVVAPCPVLDEAILLASELAANAVAHTVTGSGGHFDVTIYRAETLVVIAVRDEGSGGAPAARPLDKMAEDGRGLGLVELIADRWGHCGDEHGRTIWLQLRWKNL
jgi:anti-sigma regulatory factor (Ser/Thr protein kinase)